MKTDSNPPPLGWRWLGSIVAVQLGVCLYFARFALIDDAFIAFRYAENLLHGNGLVFNIGERVEGYTCFLWIMLLGLPSALGIDLVMASQVLGAGFLVITLILTARFLPHDPKRPAWATLLAPAFLVANCASAMWSVHGLETAMFTCLLTSALRAYVRDHAGTRFTTGWSGLLYALASLTRPEAALIFAASFLFWALTNPRALASLAIWRHALQFVAIAGPYELWRYTYYGDLLPNTFYTKVGMSVPLVTRGAAYVAHFPVESGGLLFLAIIPALAAARRDRRLAFLAWILAAFVIVVALEGGDAFPAWRFLVPIFPVTYLLVQEGLYRLLDWSRAHAARRGAAAAGAALAVLLSAATLHSWLTFRQALREARGADAFTRDMTLAGACLKRHVPSSTKIAVNPAGAVPYYSGLYAYDMLGLTNRHIAHLTVSRLGTGYAGHEKGDGAYILDQRPDLILFGNVQIAPTGPVDLGRVRWRVKFRSETEIARDPRVTQMYVPDQLPLDDRRYLLFLRRRDFLLGEP